MTRQTRKQKIDRQRGAAADRAFDPVRAAIDAGELTIGPAPSTSRETTSTVQREPVEALIAEIREEMRLLGWDSHSMGINQRLHQIVNRLEACLRSSLPNDQCFLIGRIPDRYLEVLANGAEAHCAAMKVKAQSRGYEGLQILRSSLPTAKKVAHD